MRFMLICFGCPMLRFLFCVAVALLHPGTLHGVEGARKKFEESVHMPLSAKAASTTFQQKKGFQEQLHDILHSGAIYQKQPSIYYDAGNQTEFRRSDAVRCEPSFTKAHSLWNCQKLAILLHGFTSCPGMWYALQPRLQEKGFCVLRPTLPGHGYKPREVGTNTLKVRIDSTIWSKMSGLPARQVSKKDDGFKIWTGLYVKENLDHMNGKSADELMGSVRYEVVDVKQGMFFNYNTLVAKFEVGGNLDMILPGDLIQSIKPSKIHSHAIRHEDGELCLWYPADDSQGMVTNAADYWSSPWNYIELQIERKSYEDNLDDLPAGNQWTVYVDFAERLAKLATAFKEENPSGEIVMMGHSLGAATATATMLHAARGPHTLVFDRVLVFNAAFGVNPSFGSLLKSVGSWLPFGVSDAKCDKTRHTLSTGGYCKFRTDHAVAINAFGTYALCSLIVASTRDGPPLWCKGSFKTVPLLRAEAPIAASVQLVTTSGDIAIDNSRHDRAVKELIDRFGRSKVGSCRLEGELGHNFLNELSATSKRDFWWNALLNNYTVNFLDIGEKFPLERNNEYMCQLYYTKRHESERRG